MIVMHQIAINSNNDYCIKRLNTWHIKAFRQVILAGHFGRSFWSFWQVILVILAGHFGLPREEDWRLEDHHQPDQRREKRRGEEKRREEKRRGDDQTRWNPRASPGTGSRREERQRNQIRTVNDNGTDLEREEKEHISTWSQFPFFLFLRCFPFSSEEQDKGNGKQRTEKVHGHEKSQRVLEQKQKYTQ